MPDYLSNCITGILSTVFRLLLIMNTMSAVAWDVVSPFADPLETLPKIIGAGVILPGDNQPVACPVSKDFATPLTLSEAVDLALCNNPQIQAAWATIKVQAGALGEARAAYLPTISGTTSFLQTNSSYHGNNPATTSQGQTIYSTLSWRLFDFGGREANREAANKLLISAIASHDAVIQKTLSAVIQAFFDAQTAKTELVAMQQNEDIARITFETSQRREDWGTASRGDTLQSETALAKQVLEKNRAIGLYQKNLAVLRYALGVSQQTKLILDEDLREKADLESRNLETWLELAGTNHPAIQAAQAKWESSKQKISAMHSDSLPTLDVAANYYQNGYPGQGLSPTISHVSSVGLTLTIPFFDGFAHTYKVRGAEAQAEQQKAELLDIENSILLEVVKIHADASIALQNLKSAEKLLEVAKESHITSQRRYDKGVTSILEILNTQRALSEAQQERIRSMVEWRSTRFRLLTSVGLMSRELLFNK